MNLDWPLVNLWREQQAQQDPDDYVKQQLGQALRSVFIVADALDTASVSNVGFQTLYTKTFAAGFFKSVQQLNTILDWQLSIASADANAKTFKCFFNSVDLLAAAAWSSTASFCARGRLVIDTTNDKFRGITQIGSAMAAVEGTFNEDAAVAFTLSVKDATGTAATMHLKHMLIEIGKAASWLR